jgi:hypothetical protein
MDRTLSLVGKRLVGLVGVLSLCALAALPVFADGPPSKDATAAGDILVKGTHGGAAADPAVTKPKNAVANKGSGGDGGIADQL